MIIPPQTTALRRWLPALVWMALIFLGSGSVLSGQHTSRLVEPLLRWLFGGHLSTERIETVHLLIRKAGHVTEFAVLCLLYRQALCTASSPAWRMRRVWLPVMLATGYAMLDEFHQSFVPERSASPRDVLIDACGALFAIILVESWKRTSRQEHARHASARR